MSNQKKRFKAHIGQQTYTIVGNKSDEHMQVVVDTLNDQIKEIKKASHQIDDERASILVAVNAVSNQIEMYERLMEIEADLEFLDENSERDGDE